MYSVYLRQGAAAAILIFLLLLIGTTVPSLFESEKTTSASIPKVTKLSDINYKPTSLAQFKAALGILNKLQPESELVDATIPEEVPKQSAEEIDKTLYKGFAEFSSTHQIGLIGIFGQRKAFAVLQLTDYTTKKSTWHKVELNDIFEGFKIVEISDISLKLQNATNQNVVELKLFK